MKHPIDLGIDLGTTFSVLAVNGRVEIAADYPGGPGRYLEECDVTIIPSPVGELTFPSVVIPRPDHPGEWLFGLEAAQLAHEGLAPVMFSKRRIGTNELIPVAGGTVTAREVATLFLRHLKSCAEQALGRPVERAVITHPAYFSRGAVEETRAAAQDAGFDMSLPQQLLMEPVAAALCYTRSDARDPLRVLTYDLGGGTFDVTCLERREGVISMQAFDGNHLLGGYNFDRALLHLVFDRLKKAGRTIRLDESRADDRGRLARLLRIAEEVKIKLSEARSDTEPVDFRAMNALVDSDDRPLQINERVTREAFVAAIAEDLNAAVACCHRTLGKSGLQPEDLHEILLVGGSSRGPWVSASLHAAFPQLTPLLFQPDLCVGAGAAIHARMALPKDWGRPAIDAENYHVSLEVPEATTLDLINVVGRIEAGAGANQPVETLVVTVVPEEGSAPDPVTPDANGHFVFGNVELALDAENKFTLRIAPPGGKAIYERSITVRQTSSLEVASTMTVLPRPLYIETVTRGRVALAAEGVPLPARCVAHFERNNSNPSMDLQLFQDGDPVGLVHIENIPAEAGEGSPVELTLEITGDNYVHGDVVISSRPDGAGRGVKREILRSKIKVQFNPTDIPSREKLEAQYVADRGRWQKTKTDAPEFAEDIEGKATAALDNIRHLLDQPLVERQEVHAALRALNQLLIAPGDEMAPTRLEFKRRLREVRELLADVKNAAAKKEQSRGAERDQTATSRQALGTLEQRLREVEQNGFAVHQQRDRSAWSDIQADVARVVRELMEIDAVLRPREDFEKVIHQLVQEAPGVVKAALIELFVLPLRQQLAEAEAELGSKGKGATWRREIDDISAQIGAVQNSVVAIDENLTPAQLDGKIRRVLQALPRIEGRIKSLGINLR